MTATLSATFADHVDHNGQVFSFKSAPINLSKMENGPSQAAECKLPPVPILVQCSKHSADASFEANNVAFSLASRLRQSGRQSLAPDPTQWLFSADQAATRNKACEFDDSCGRAASLFDFPMHSTTNCPDGVVLS